MSKTRVAKRFIPKRTVALAAVPLSAAFGLVGYNVLYPAAAGATSGSKNNAFIYTDDGGHAVRCQIAQHIDKPHNKDAQLGFGSTTLSLVSGPAGDCTSFTNSFCQSATWTDTFGQQDGSSSFDCRAAGNSNPFQVEYVLVGSGAMTLTSTVTFTHCIETANNHCTANLTFSLNVSGK